MFRQRGRWRFFALDKASSTARHLGRCLKARRQTAVYALLVDVKHKQVKAFYLHDGFVALRDRSLTLFLSLRAGTRKRTASSH